MALAVYSLFRVTEHYFNINHDFILGLFIFLSTITGYNFVKYAGVAKFYHKSLTSHLKVIQIFSALSFIGLVYLGTQLSPRTISFFIPLILITVLYAVPFLAGFQKSLRAVSYLKIFLVTIVWAGTTTTIPFLVNGYEIGSIAILLFFQRLLFVVILTLPFEIRDVNIDVPHVKTLPQRIGIPQTKKLGLAFMLFCLVFEFMITNNLVLRNIFLAICIVTLIFLMRTSNKQSKYYSSFWVESIPVFWWLLILLFS